MLLHEEEEEDEDEESVKIIFTCISYLMIFSSNFLHAVTFYMFSTLIFLEDRLRLKLKVKTKNVLMYGYNAGPPMAIPIYTVLPYCVIPIYTVLPYCVIRRY